MIRIVTDGAADMPSGWEQEYDIQVVPINIQFGEKTYLQGIDLSNDDFYHLVDESGQIPKTSQPTPFQFEQAYRRVAKKGDTILSIHVTSKLSGTYNSALVAARELGDECQVLPIDSGCGSAGLGMMCREARLMERAGATLQEIVQRLSEIRENLEIVLTLDKLDYARMSGRVSTLQAALASALNVKPIITLREGLLDVTERVRTRGKALNRVVELLVNKFGKVPVNLAAVHARDPESAKILIELAKKFFNIRDLITTDLSISVAANLGPGTAGLIVYPTGE